MSSLRIVLLVLSFLWIGYLLYKGITKTDIALVKKEPGSLDRYMKEIVISFIPATVIILVLADTSLTFNQIAGIILGYMSVVGLTIFGYIRSKRNGRP